ncbi:MAG: hypothetical protein PHI96_03675 [Desulfovibrio sp.]|nr:hypothetical protein [Desulfovibrio sp.]
MADLILTRPLGGQQTVVNNVAEGSIVLDFPATDATLGREGNALTFTFEGGAKINLEGFYSDYSSENTPNFLVDGQAIAGKDFFSALGQDDLMPAAGPASVDRSSHYVEHADSSLETGVNHLDGLDWQMQNAVAVGDTLATENLFVRGDSDQAGGPGGGGTAPDGYHTRLVVSAGGSQPMLFHAIDENGHPVTDASLLSVAFAGGSSAYFTAPVVDPVTGLITITLTAAGQAALAAGTKFDSVLEVTVGGKTYNMDLLGNDSSSYDYVQREGETNLGGPLKGEWYSSQGTRVSEENITLGGDSYNSALVENTTASGDAYGALNANISFAHDTEGKIDISARAENGNAYGNYAYAGDGDVTTTVDAGTKGDVNLTAISDTGTAMAFATESGRDADGDFYETTANVRGHDINFTAEGNEKMAVGIWGAGKSTVNVEAEGDVNFSSTVNGGTVNYMASAVFAKEQATVNISGQNVSGETNVYGSGNPEGPSASSVFRTTAGTTLNIETAEDGKFSASAYQETSPYSSPYTGIAWSGGRAAGFTSTGLSASGNLNQAGQGGKSYINITTGDVDISAIVDAASPVGPATGIYAGYGGNVDINTSDGNNELNITGNAPSWGTSIFSTNYGTTAINTGAGDDVINLNASAHNGAAAIGLAAQAGGKTVIDGGSGNDTLNINATFTGPHTLSTDYMGGTKAGAFGMNAAWGGAVNKITNVDNVNITADASGSDSGWAYGMYAHEDWHGAVKNIIENTDSPITVVITAKAGTTGEAYAMFGTQNAANIIQGGSKAGDVNGDSITLTGHIGGSYNTANTITTGSGNDNIEINGSLRNGTNTFNMGDGNDIFTLNGNISGGTNKILMGTGDGRVNIHGDVTGGSTNINLGAGDDTVTVDGHVQGNLTIIGGDGYDLLVLKADSYADFIAKYDTWLQNNLTSIDVEEIHVSINGLSPADQADLHAYLNSGHFSDYVVNYSDGAIPLIASLSEHLPDGYREAGLEGYAEQAEDGGSAAPGVSDTHTASASDDISSLVAQQQITTESGG